MIIKLFNKAIEEHLLTPLDVQFAYNITKCKNPALLLITALLSAETISGHVCLALSDIVPDKLFSGRSSELAKEFWCAIGALDAKEIYLTVKNAQSVALAGENKLSPLVLSGDFLYFRRLWQDEQKVFKYFSYPIEQKYDTQAIKLILNSLFPKHDKEINWQKIATAIAVTSQISIILGGPGTGKTTTVAQILIILIKLSINNNKNIKIELAAPTGKATSRLTESLGTALNLLSLTHQERQMLPNKAKTLHKLLGAKPESQHFHYNRENLIEADILIIDEASMIDLSMMANLIEALHVNTRLIFLGDQNQLASIESGAVIKDICECTSMGYSFQRTQELTQLTGYSLNKFIAKKGPLIRNSICFLRKNYRFSSSSGIGQLAVLVNKGNAKLVERFLKKTFSDINSYVQNDEHNYSQMLLTATGLYHNYFLKIKENNSPEEILRAFNHYRLLTALREGPYGMIGLNEKLEKLLCKQGFIYCPFNRCNKYYAGRPIMISGNDNALSLFNGDIGIILPDNEGVLKAYFQSSDGKIKDIQLNRLPLHETAYVMTVHKSQGSEFTHAALVLPKSYSPIITRELIYTGITRAKKELSLYYNLKILRRAIETPSKRRSGLVMQLNSLN
ncbi:RecBCD enzyme subunit RecD [Candidatus Hartigia pinicola]|nr:RecBCD enzyme subunit RecD [Candidatus Hartigia pinicola]